MTDTHAQCDHCDTYAEVHHNEATGLALCEDCDSAQNALSADPAEAAREFAATHAQNLMDNIAACGGARLMTGFVATAYKYGIDPELLRVEIARVARLHGREDVAEKVEAIDPTDED